METATISPQLVYENLDLLEQVDLVTSKRSPIDSTKPTANFPSRPLMGMTVTSFLIQSNLFVRSRQIDRNLTSPQPLSSNAKVYTQVNLSSLQSI
jgi:hypothetical protein